MIRLTRLNHVPLILNSDLIEHIEITPDTVIALTTGQRFLVLETADEVVEKVISFRREITQASETVPAQHSVNDVTSQECEAAAEELRYGR